MASPTVTLRPTNDRDPLERRACNVGGCGQRAAWLLQIPGSPMAYHFVFCAAHVEALGEAALGALAGRAGTVESASAVGL